MRSLRRCCVLVALGAMLWTPLGASTARAQPLPGMHGEGQGTGPKTRRARATSRPRSVEDKKEALQKKIEEEKPSIWRRVYLTAFSEHSPYRSVLLAVITLVVLLTVKRYTTRLMRRYADPRAQKKENVSRFLRTWNWAWRFVIAVFVIVALSGSLKLLGLSAAFLGMMLGWSLQAPVTGIAAWLMILLKRPFRIGDRIIIGNFIGDVTDITLTHVILNQVGGTVGGEEPSGRGVLVPNAILFGQIITNYTLEEKHVLDEVPVRLTFDSDYEVAKGIMLNAAREVAADIIAETGQEPFLRCEFFDAGILVRLRYYAVPNKRQELSSLITEKILAGFKQHYPAVKYCLPQSVIRYHWEAE